MLSELNCSDTLAKELDLSKNAELTKLTCSNAKLYNLDLSGTQKLTYLFCSGNSLEKIDLTNNYSLIYLDCSKNCLTSIDLSSNTALTTLNLNYNKLTALDLSKNTALKNIYCNRNCLTSLDLSNQNSLKNVSVSDNEYEVGTVKGRYYLKQLPGNFDPSRATDWVGAKYDNVTCSLTKFEDYGGYYFVTYKYTFSDVYNGLYNGEFSLFIEDYIDVSITNINISGNNVLVYYSDNSVDKYTLDNLPTYIIDEMADKNIQYVIDYVNAFSSSSDNKILTDAQLYAIELVLQNDYASIS